MHSLVYIDILVANWKLSIYSCGWWLKHRICRHVIDAAVILGLIEYPTEAKNIPLGQKRKRERPEQNTAALIRQPSESYSQQSTQRTTNSSDSSDGSSSPKRSSSAVFCEACRTQKIQAKGILLPK